jgi:alkylation response protein AidB-like acyl-CoA dehydrogenase
VGLTPEQVEYYNVANQFAADELAPHAARWDEEKIFPEEALRKAAALGFGGMFVRADVGGTGLSRSDSVPIIEALAGADTSTTAYLTIHNMVAGLVDAYGSADQRTAWLPKLLTMEHFASYCLTEAGAGSDAASLKTRAVREGDHYVINGSKQFISGGGRSDVYAVMVRTADTGADGITCVLVPAGTPGLSFGKQERKLGWNTQPTAAVFLENVRVPVANRLGKEGEGFRIAMRALDGGRSK